ncbi:MAG: hypothetical protein JO340_17150 [Acidobacteriaceae bacterium]|nr:hypothetical protein [Acidobacteriaceae bacterium]
MPSSAFHPRPRLIVRPVLLAAVALGAFAQSNPPPADISYRADIRQDFIKFDPNYRELRSALIPRARALGQQVFAAEKQGRDVACAHQIILEIKWLFEYTADFARIAHRLDDLDRALAHPESQPAGRLQNPADGACGQCYTEWFFRLDATYDYLKETSPTYPLRFLDRVNSPEKLRAYFATVSTSDIARTGLNHRRELNESLADLLRLILHDQPAGYSWTPDMKSAMLDLILHRLRNPETGWWGARYLHNGKTYFVDDISITFHMLSYLNGNVPDLSKVLHTALALKDLDYPQGWLEDGQYTNHNNMDAVVLFHYGWSAATPAEKAVIAAEIRKMLAWCLADSLQSDGSFRSSPADDSIEEAEYFGAAFLARIGFFDKSRRFWTTEDFAQSAAVPNPDEIRRRIRAFIAAHRSTGAAGGSYYISALEQLDAATSPNP